MTTEQHLNKKNSLLERKIKSLSDNIELKQPIVLSTDQTNISFLTFITKIENQNIYLHNSVPLNLIKAVIKSQSSSLTFQDFSLKGENLTGDGKYIIFKPIDLVTFDETRLEQRSSFQSWQKVFLEFTNPIDKRTKFKRKILDLSNSGLSFESFYDSLLFKKGNQLLNVFLSIENKKIRSFDATIIYQKQLYNFDHKMRYQVGLKLENLRDLEDE